MSEQYERAKEAARERAKCIQIYLSTASISYAELADIQARLEKMAKNYGLLQEFRENGLL